ncbi:MAG: hypothetical protein WC477_01595 [Patescibacteria group bacterium]
MAITLVFFAIIAYAILLGVLWVWAILHAFSTPKIPLSRRGLWTIALVFNPSATMWYWYVWRRWAFWTLFIPAILFAAFLPLTLERVIQVLSIRDVADRFVAFITPITTHFVQAIPILVAIPLFAFPYILRFAALAHLGGNDKLDAADRNDQAVTFALPIFGYGGALAYCLKWRRGWALAGLVWSLLATAMTATLLSRIWS